MTTPDVGLHRAGAMQLLAACPASDLDIAEQLLAAYSRRGLWLLVDVWRVRVGMLRGHR